MEWARALPTGWKLMDGDRVAGAIKHDGTQYRDGDGGPLGANWGEAKQKVEERARKGK